VEWDLHASPMHGTRSHLASNSDCSVDILDVSCEIRYGGSGIGSVSMSLWFVESNPVEESSWKGHELEPAIIAFLGETF
jgi:hypothetical protein